MFFRNKLDQRISDLEKEVMGLPVKYSDKVLAMQDRLKQILNLEVFPEEIYEKGDDTCHFRPQGARYYFSMLSVEGNLYVVTITHKVFPIRSKEDFAEFLRTLP